MFRKWFVIITVILAMMFSTTFAFAAADPGVTIISPASQSTIVSNNLLISIKITQPKAIRVYVYEKKQMVGGSLKSINLNALTSNPPSANTLRNDLIMSAPFTCNNNLSFYTKQINVSPGLYEVKVDTIDSAGRVKYTNYSYVGVKESQAAASGLFETEQSGAFQFLQNILKSIF